MSLIRGRCQLRCLAPLCPGKLCQAQLTQSQLIGPCREIEEVGSDRAEGRGEIAGTQDEDCDIGGDIDPDKWEAFLKNIKTDRENVPSDHSDDDATSDDHVHEKDDSEPQLHEDEVTFECQECTDEAQIPKVITDPGDPSPEEIEEHYLSKHLPFRAWCKCCVLAKAKDSQYKRIEHGKVKDGVSIVGLDFCHPGEDDDSVDKMAILVVKDFPSKALFSHACSSKAVDERVAGKVVEDIESLGGKKIILRSDSDKSIKALRQVISSTRIE